MVIPSYNRRTHMNAAKTPTDLQEQIKSIDQEIAWWTKHMETEAAVKSYTAAALTQAKIEGMRIVRCLLIGE